MYILCNIALLFSSTIHQNVHCKCEPSNHPTILNVLGMWSATLVNTASERISRQKPVLRTQALLSEVAIQWRVNEGQMDLVSTWSWRSLYCYDRIGNGGGVDSEMLDGLRQDGFSRCGFVGKGMIPSFVSTYFSSVCVCSPLSSGFLEQKCHLDGNSCLVA